ncbi:uncharacterized protein LOC141657763 [Silene latifolia]|uniref:uncharacterized protein LOC141657763 n=1 Tax=Silene latifolia TaxID=37657 RepID=UPI003D774A59
MLSVPKSKSKDQKAAKEQKTPLKSTVVLNGGNGLPASAYNPLLGTFLTLDTSSTSSPQILHGNGRFGNIDDSESHNGGTHGSGGDCDSASNNDTRSVESEDQNKEKSNAPNKLGLVPGADNDKREKIRQKNERKHQRQKEKRAQELHERCNGYLMSRKLESLAQQLVGMGFSHERATMALILNEGRVEEAVSWLFEGGEDSDRHKDKSLASRNNNLKIDISDETARIAEMEIKFKCSKQDVERAIVSCEGDLEKAEEALKSHKPEPAVVPPKPEENVRLIQPKPNSVPLILQRRDDKDVTNTKFPALVGLAPKSMSKAVLPVTRFQSKVEWARPPSEKNWPVGGGSTPSVSHSLSPPLQVSPPPLKGESCYVQQGSVREPVLMMQRIQSVNTKLAPVTSISSSPPGGAVSWYPSSSDVMKSNEFSLHIPSTRSPSPNDPYYHPNQSQHQHQAFMLGSSSQMDNSVSNRVNEPFPRMGASPTQPLNPGSSPMVNRVNDPFSRSGPSSTISAASAVGMFSGLGSTYSPNLVSPVDWNTSSSMQPCDYTSIDWSLDKNFLSTKPNGLWLNFGPYSSGNHSGGVNLALRPSSLNGNDGANMGLQDGGAATADSLAAGSHEWTSPFEGKDLFSLPRQTVFSPSL